MEILEVTMIANHVIEMINFNLMLIEGQSKSVCASGINKWRSQQVPVWRSACSIPNIPPKPAQTQLFMVRQLSSMTQCVKTLQDFALSSSFNLWLRDPQGAR